MIRFGVGARRPARRRVEDQCLPLERPARNDVVNYDVVHPPLVRILDRFAGLFFFTPLRDSRDALHRCFRRLGALIGDFEVPNGVWCRRRPRRVGASLTFPSEAQKARSKLAVSASERSQKCSEHCRSRKFPKPREQKVILGLKNRLAHSSTSRSSWLIVICRASAVRSCSRRTMRARLNAEQIYKSDRPTSRQKNEMRTTCTSRFRWTRSRSSGRPAGWMTSSPETK